MATYRFGKWSDMNGVVFFSIDKKVWYGWSEQKYWVISSLSRRHDKEREEHQRKLMMESVERLIKAGHTVI